MIFATCFVAHREQEIFLRVEVEILEDIRRHAVRQDAEKKHLLLAREIGEKLREIGRRPVAKNIAQRGEVSRLDQLTDFRFEEIANHAEEVRRKLHEGCSAREEFWRAGWKKVFAAGRAAGRVPAL